MMQNSPDNSLLVVFLVHLLFFMFLVGNIRQKCIILALSLDCLMRLMSQLITTTTCDE